MADLEAHATRAEERGVVPDTEGKAAVSVPGFYAGGVRHTGGCGCGLLILLAGRKQKQTKK